VTGRSVKQIRIIGGGSKNDLLNQFTADATGLPVFAGPAEATVLGNIGIQMLATGCFSSLAEARSTIENSFPTKPFLPSEPEVWDRESARFQQYCGAMYA
jgi:rhamnulokinase